jgi:hypothetical protein
MTHPGLEVSQAGARRGQSVAGMPQIVEVQARNAEFADSRMPT